MTAGIWTLTDEGTFVLEEPYNTMLLEAKLMATKGWRDGLFGYLEERCPYTREELNQSLLARTEENVSAEELLNEFVLEALTGDL